MLRGPSRAASVGSMASAANAASPTCIRIWPVQPNVKASVSSLPPNSICIHERHVLPFLQGMHCICVRTAASASASAYARGCLSGHSPQDGCGQRNVLCAFAGRFPSLLPGRKACHIYKTSFALFYSPFSSLLFSSLPFFSFPFFPFCLLGRVLHRAAAVRRCLSIKTDWVAGSVAVHVSAIGTYSLIHKLTHLLTHIT